MLKQLMDEAHTDSDVFVFRNNKPGTGCLKFSYFR